MSSKPGFGKRPQPTQAIVWAETLADAKVGAGDDGRLLLTYIFSPG